MKSHLLHLVSALIIVIAVFFGYGIWYSTIVDKSAVVASLQDQIVEKAETASRTASARVALAEIAGGGTSVQSYFVPETGVVAFIDGLEARGKEQGATVDVLSVSKSSGAQPVFTLALAITGTFDAIMRTVGAIEYAPYDLSISTLSLGQDGKNGWNANLNLLVGSVNSVSMATSTP